MQDREVMFFLQSMNGFGKKTIKRLWDYFGCGKEIFEAPQVELEKLLLPAQYKTFLWERERKNPCEEIMRLKNNGIDYYSIFDKEYPRKLLQIADRPNGLFVRGTLPREDVFTVSVVGTRKHSYYGEKQTKQYSRMIAEKGIPIVSGMAKGIDGIAQRTALEYGGETYAVLGCGVDICYPQENEWLFERIPDCGGIISEYPPGTMPAAGLFPLRNRIISAFCDILLVMEAREKSGTFITVDMALEQGKEIWVLPGRVDDVLSKGCNRLISQGAEILPCVVDFEEELDTLCIKYGKQAVRASPQKRTISAGKMQDDMNEKSQLSYLEKAVVTVLDYQPLSLNGIYDKLDVESKRKYSIQQVSLTLMELCMKRMARQVGGSYYTRC